MRRNDVRRWSLAEKAIQHAVDVTEAAGADPRLTDAVILLGDARSRVADFVDDVITAPQAAHRGKVYYAHCLAIYDTPQEARDITTLQALGLSVMNPNDPQVAADVKRLKDQNVPNCMDYFRNLIRACSVLVFRALPDGSISAGVWKEIQFAREFGLPVIELPSAMERRVITLEATREYLHEIGQR